MLNISIIANQEKNRKYDKKLKKIFDSACDEYLKRLTRYAKIKPYSPDKEAFNIHFLISVGSTLTSDECSKLIEDIQIRGISHINFFLGEGQGDTENSMKVNLGIYPITTNLQELLLHEQIYRFFRILSGHSYHK